MQFSRDGKYIVSGGEDMVMRVINLESDFVSVFLGNQGFINSVVFSGDMEWLASGGDDKILRLYNFESTRPTQSESREFKGN